MLQRACCGIKMAACMGRREFCGKNMRWHETASMPRRESGERMLQCECCSISAAASMQGCESWNIDDALCRRRRECGGKMRLRKSCRTNAAARVLQSKCCVGAAA